MSLFPIISPGGGGNSYVCDAVVFDGTNDWIGRASNLTGVVDGKSATGQFSVKMGASTDGSAYTLYYNGGGYGELQRLASNKLQLKFYEATGQVIKLSLVSTTSIVEADNWVTYTWSFNVATAAGQLLRDGVDDLASSTLTDEDLAFNRSTHTIAGHDNSSAQFLGEIADFWMLFNEYDDIGTNVANYFLDGKPTDPGATGTNFTGTQPHLLHHLGAGEGTPDTNYAANAGSGGSMTLSGALSVAGTSPTD